MDIFYKKPRSIAGVFIFIGEDINHDDYGWQFGRVEHSEKFSGYYFYNEGGVEHHSLTTGMLSAVRLSMLMRVNCLS